MLINKLYRLLHNKYAFVYIMFLVLFANATLVLADGLIAIFIPMLIYTGLSAITLSMWKGKIRLNKDILNIPVMGEKIIITKQFFCDDNLIWKKIPNKTGTYTHMNVGDEWEIYHINELADDFIFRAKDKVNDTVRFRYFDSEKYWDTKSNIRDKKLKKLGIK